MRKIILFILFNLIMQLCWSQFSGYQRKRLEVSLTANISAKPAVYKAMSYKSDEFGPNKFKAPVDLGVQINLATKYRFGIGIAYWRGVNYISYQNKPARESDSFNYKVGLANNNILNYILEEGEDFEREIFEFNYNQAVSTEYRGVQARFYHSSGLAPAADYWTIGLGSIGVKNHSDVIYEMPVRNEILKLIQDQVIELPNNISLLDETLFIESPDFKRIRFLSIGANRRYKISKSSPLLLDIGFETMWRLFARRKLQPDYLENSGPGVLTNGVSVVGYEIESINEVIKSNTYTWIIKQNFLKLNFKLSYLF